jgi:hypothetical protein
MKCINPSCGKKIVTPLELFNGVLTCPYCKSELTVIKDFKITLENNDLYNLSELYYFKYLTLVGSDKERTDKTIKTENATLLTAISTCKEAAYSGHPQAVFKMGNYYESYFESELSDADRKRIAFEYYAALCYSNLNTVPKDDGITGFGATEFLELKRLAAKRLYQMVVSSDKDFGGFKKYDREYNIERITSIYGAMEFDKNIYTNGGGGKDEDIKKLFLSSVSRKGRAPLFGIYKLSGAELKNIFSGTDDKSKQIFRIITKGLEVRYIESENGRVDEIDGYFTKMSNTLSALNNLEEIKDIKEYYLYFFNTGGKHAYLSGGQMNKIKRTLEENYFERIKRLINGGAEDYTFFDDDIVMFMKGNNFGAAIESLMDYICEEN